MDAMKAAWEDPQKRYTWLITMGALAVLVIVNRSFQQR